MINNLFISNMKRLNFIIAAAVIAIAAFAGSRSASAADVSQS